MITTDNHTITTKTVNIHDNKDNHTIIENIIDNHTITMKTVNNHDNQDIHTKLKRDNKGR